MVKNVNLKVSIEGSQIMILLHVAPSILLGLVLWMRWGEEETIAKPAPACSSVPSQTVLWTYGSNIEKKTKLFELEIFL